MSKNTYRIVIMEESSYKSDNDQLQRLVSEYKYK